MITKAPGLVSQKTFSPRLAERPALAHACQKRGRQLEILVVEDNPGDSELLKTAFAGWESEVRLTVVRDGEQALLYVYQKDGYAAALRPDIVILDLNLPRKNGLEVLATMKSDVTLQQIPVVVLSTSDSKEDVTAAYRLHANCYITKTLDVHEFFAKIRTLEEFWLFSVRLPSDEPSY